MTADAVFFGAHPDDVELSSGGLAALLASHGHRVVVADLTRGEMASRGTVEERAIEAHAIWRGWRAMLPARDAIAPTASCSRSIAAPPVPT